MKQDTGKKIIFILFFASGISGLIYEVVWLRILSRIIGVTTYATAVTLASFMAGLAIGSLIFGRFIDKHRDPLRIYALLQLSIAGVAVITPIVLKISIPLYQYVYHISSESDTLIAVLRIVVSFMSLLIPAALMGGTLPVLTSYLVKREGLFGKNFSLLYGINTLGAVLGVLLSGFITIGALGEWNTIFVGVLINFIVGAIAYSLYSEALAPAEKTKAHETKYGEPEVFARVDISISPYSDVVRKMVLFAILLSGFTALSYEVIWTRQLILFLRTSIYAFSGMLAVFLTGIGVGSIFMNKIVDKLKTPLLIFGTLELAVGILSISNLYLFSPIDSSPASRFLSPVILVFPITFLFGAIFPLASLCYIKSASSSGASVGMVYTFNTIGNVSGSILTGFLFIGLFGSCNTVILLGFLNAALGLVLLWSEPNRSSIFKVRFLAAIPVIILLALGLTGKDPFLNLIERRIIDGASNYEIFHNRETTEGTVTAFAKNNQKRISINGAEQTVLCTETKLMAHLPMLLTDNAHKALVICFGMGTTVKSASLYDNLNITSVELVPDVYKCFGYYHSNAQEIMSRKNYIQVASDGRNFLLLSSEKYDIITVDPSPPIHSAGTVNLYTREFFSLCRDHLTQKGVMCLWFPGGPKEDSLSIFKTFYSVFPNMTVWQGTRGWGCYIIGTLAETKIDIPKIEKAFTNPKLLKDLKEYDNSCVTSSQLLNLLSLKGKNNIENITRDAVIITDNFPYTEFPLWRYLFRKK
jgi:spermidine synthase